MSRDNAQLNLAFTSLQQVFQSSNNMDSPPDQLSFYGKVAFIVGGLAIMTLVSYIIEYALKRLEEQREYDEIVADRCNLHYVDEQQSC